MNLNLYSQILEKNLEQNEVFQIKDQDKNINLQFKDYIFTESFQNEKLTITDICYRKVGNNQFLALVISNQMYVYQFDRNQNHYLQIINIQINHDNSEFFNPDDIIKIFPPEDEILYCCSMEFLEDEQQNIDLYLICAGLNGVVYKALVLTDVNQFQNQCQQQQKPALKYFNCHLNLIYQIKTAPVNSQFANSNIALTCSKDGSALLVNLFKESIIAIYKQYDQPESDILGVSWHFSGLSFVTLSSDSSIKIWEIDDKTIKLIQQSNSDIKKQKIKQQLKFSHKIKFINEMAHQFLDQIEFLYQGFYAKNQQGHISHFFFTNDKNDACHVRKNWQLNKEVTNNKFHIHPNQCFLTYGNDIGNIYIIQINQANNNRNFKVSIREEEIITKVIMSDDFNQIIITTFSNKLVVYEIDQQLKQELKNCCDN